MIYLDYAAATPVDPAAQAAMQPFLADQFYNPSAGYLAAKDVATQLNTARARVAKVIGAKSSEVIFTAGGTEANNLAIHGVMQQYPKANLVISAIEHESVLEPAKQYAHKLAVVDGAGLVEITNLLKQIDDHTVLVSIIYANNEIGTIQPLADIARKLADIRAKRRQNGNDLPLYLHTDACQAGVCLDLHVSRLGVDLMTINGGKVYGPKQSGALYVKAGVQLRPQILGGGQEFGMRSGTENVAGAVGLSVALELAQNGRTAEQKRLASLQKVFIDTLQKALPDVRVNGSLKHRLASNINICLPGQDNERLMMLLDESGVQCATGSACSASSDQPSTVLKAIGLSNAEAQASLRFSMGKSTTQADVLKVVSLLSQMVQI